MKKLPFYSAFFARVTLISTGCTTLNPLTSDQSKRQKILDMRNATLQDFYAIKPQVKSLIGSAPSYAVFSDANVNVIFASFTGGYGVLTETWTGQETYMRMGEADNYKTNPQPFYVFVKVFLNTISNYRRLY